jgi:hypothetical protein
MHGDGGGTVVLISHGGYVEAVSDYDLAGIGEEGGSFSALLRGRERVESTGEHQHGHRREYGAVRDGLAGGMGGRGHGPGKAHIQHAGGQRHAAILADGEGRIDAGIGHLLLPDIGERLGGSQGGERGHIVDLRVIGAAYGHEEGGAVTIGLAAGAVRQAGAVVFGDQAQEGKAVAAIEVGARGGVELAVNDRLAGVGVSLVGETFAIGIDSEVLAVAIGRGAGEGMGFERSEQSGDAADGSAGDIPAIGVLLAGDIEGVAHGAGGFGVPGGFADDGPGAIEDEGAEEIAMAGGEGLAEVAAVGIAIEVDLGDGEGGQDGGEVVGGEAGTVEIGGGAEEGAAKVDIVEGAVAIVLEGFAIEGLGFAGAAIVDQQEVAGVEQGVEERKVAGAAAGGWIAGSAFDGYDGSGGGLGRVAMGEEFEGDLEDTGDFAGGIERAGDGAAVGGNAGAGGEGEGRGG